MSQPQPPQGLKGGVIFFSLRQRPGHGICRPADSCVLQLLNSQTQGRCQFGEGGEHRRVHSHFTSSSRSPCMCNASCCLSRPNEPPCTPKTQNFGTRTPIPRGSTYSSRMHLSCQACCHHLWAPLPGQGGARRRGCLEGNWDPWD